MSEPKRNDSESVGWTVRPRGRRRDGRDTSTTRAPRAQSQPSYERVDMWTPTMLVLGFTEEGHVNRLKSGLRPGTGSRIFEGEDVYHPKSFSNYFLRPRKTRTDHSGSKTENFTE